MKTMSFSCIGQFKTQDEKEGGRDFRVLALLVSKVLLQHTDMLEPVLTELAWIPIVVTLQ